MSKKFAWLVGLSGLTLGVGIGVLGSTSVSTLHQSPYIAQTDSPIRGLSAQEIDDLLQGRGAGYARMAELNSYPGPRHVLDLKQDLALSEDQEARIQVVFEAMQSKAQKLGKDIVEQEEKLSQSFAMGAIAPNILERQTEDLATLYGTLRATHLQAHLDITPLLSEVQVTKYEKLRGYTDTSSHNSHIH